MSFKNRQYSLKLGPSDASQALSVTNFYSLVNLPLIADSVNSNLLNADSQTEATSFQRVVSNEDYYHFGATESMRSLDWTLVSAVFPDSEVCTVLR